MIGLDDWLVRDSDDVHEDVDRCDDGDCDGCPVCGYPDFERGEGR